MIVTKGEAGSVCYQSGYTESFSAPEVETVDTTAAGDAFAGGFAWARGEGYELKDAIKFAGMVAGISVTRLGAQSSLPLLAEVRKFQNQRSL